MTPRQAMLRTLQRLDAYLAREVTRLRTRYQLSLDEFRGLYISDEQVDALLGAAQMDEDKATTMPAPEPGPAWSRLAASFALSPLAQNILLLAVAADVDPKYAAIIAYLNDEVSLRWPTYDLARRLFAATPDREGVFSQAVAPDGPLFGTGLLTIVDRGAERQSAAKAAFAAAPCVADHLLDLPPRLAPGMRLLRRRRDRPAVGKTRLADLAPLLQAKDRPLILLQGEWGSGREAAAAELAGALGLALLHVDLATLQSAGTDPAARLAEAVLLARLADAALFIAADDAVPHAMLGGLTSAAVPVFIAMPMDGRWMLALKRVPVAVEAFHAPGLAPRRRLWAAALADEAIVVDDAAIDMAAARFRLTPRRIAQAAKAARIATRAADDERVEIEAPVLLAAARGQATLDLGALAVSVPAEGRWTDLVLPAVTMRQLRDVADAMVNRERVFREWGFARPGGAIGVAVLLAGGSGTGKTMSASILARETGLDLWRIDLSAVVSKYIGETERHLERIFSAARDGSAILFFDEADALFGRRSEVKDAHDRYANIEVAYLLQRLETHDGVSILATNLAKNVDPAFSRRMHAVIEFPLPDADLRERLWRNIFPPAAPLSPDVDFAFLARQFPFAGGDIRVAALDAAFLAAQDGGVVTMLMILRAVERQMRKQGKIPSATDFRQYYGSLGAAIAEASVA
jgi:hypothetical protein